MSEKVYWDPEKYRGKHEIEEHWQLRQMFMERWKFYYPEEDLLIFSKLFINVKFFECEYFPEIMNRLTKMSEQVVKDYDEAKKAKAQRTFASEATEGHARGTKREADDIVYEAPKHLKVNPGEGSSQDDNLPRHSAAGPFLEQAAGVNDNGEVINEIPETVDYYEELSHVRCLPVSFITNTMLQTRFGRLVLIVKTWASKYCNIQYSCQLCNLQFECHYDDMTSVCTIMIEGMIVAEAVDINKKQARKAAINIAWQVLIHEAITVLVKEMFISQNNTRFSFPEALGAQQQEDNEFGAPVQADVAARMMRMMGWDGGGLGPNGQGIREPVAPQLQLVARAGLGSVDAHINDIKRAADELMKRYTESNSLDIDLVFSNDFSKMERAALHAIARFNNLNSKSYGQGDERFLVIRQAIDPIQLARTVLRNGGNTQKYKLYVPSRIARFYRERE